MIFAIGVALSLLIGLTLGLLGGGGAILTLPLLVYVMNVTPSSAIPTTLFVVGATSVVGGALHARAGAVRWRTAGVFALAAMPAAFGAGRLAHLIPSSVLLVLFSIVMIVASIAMLRGRKEVPTRERQLQLGRSVVLGAAVGGLSGLVGAGGGFLVVPALALFGGLAIREAMATSLVVIALQSFAGFVGHASHAELDLHVLGAVTAASAAGSVAGAWLASRIAPASLRRGFAWLVVATALFMLAKQLPPIAAALAGAATLAVVFAAARRPAARGAAPTPSPAEPSPP